MNLYVAPEPVASGSVNVTCAFPPTSPSNKVLPACSTSVIASSAVNVCRAGTAEPSVLKVPETLVAPVPCVEILMSEFVSVDVIIDDDAKNKSSDTEISPTATVPAIVTVCDADPKTICPVPFGESVIEPLESIDSIALPSNLMLSTAKCPPSSVKFPMTSVLLLVIFILPVPPVSMLRSPFESVVIVPSAVMFKSPIESVAAHQTLPHLRMDQVLEFLLGDKIK